ncbi:hypothetical protein QN239_33345 [Mycolicibacterium sp. Y3]
MRAQNIDDIGTAIINDVGLGDVIVVTVYVRSAASPSEQSMIRRPGHHTAELVEVCAFFIGQGAITAVDRVIGGGSIELGSRVTIAVAVIAAGHPLAVTLVRI